MAQGWPLDPETSLERGADNPSLVASDFDIGQDPGDDALYLPRLKAGLEAFEALALKKHGRLPDLVLVVDGADPYEKDELPSTATMRLTLAQMLERDLLVDNFLTDRKLPAAWVNAGGYGESVWEVYAQFLEKVLPGKLI
jgi:acetoin utilization deacetylase AcuC-like enzyme